MFTSGMKVLASISAFLVPFFVHAAIENPLGPNVTFASLLVGFTNWLLGLVAVLAVLGIVAGGIRMILSIGNESSVAAAKKIVTWSVAGLAVAVLALAIVSAVARGILGVAWHFDMPPLAYEAHAADIGLDTARGVDLLEPTPAGIAQNILFFITSLAAILSLAAFIWGAVMFILSLGDESKAATAKRIMLYAIIGLLLVGGAYVVVRLVGRLLGVDSAG